MTIKSQSTLSELAKVTTAIEALNTEYAEKLAPLQLEETELRATLEQSMKSRGIKTQIDEDSNTVATLVERTDLKITDEEAVVAALRERKTLDKCLKLDTYAVKREYKTQPLAGVEEVTTSYVQVKEVK